MMPGKALTELLSKLAAGVANRRIHSVKVKVQKDALGPRCRFDARSIAIANANDTVAANGSRVSR